MALLSICDPVPRALMHHAECKAGTYDLISQVTYVVLSMIQSMIQPTRFTWAEGAASRILHMEGCRRTSEVESEEVNASSLCARTLPLSAEKFRLVNCSLSNIRFTVRFTTVSMATHVLSAVPQKRCKRRLTSSIQKSCLKASPSSTSTFIWEEIG